MMSSGFANSFESTFGPCSEPIDIPAFLAAAGGSTAGSLQVASEVADSPADVQEECSVADVSAMLNDIWLNPLLSAHLIKEHEHTVGALQSSANSKPGRLGRKAQLPGPESAQNETTQLQASLDAVRLSAYPYLGEASYFMRTPKNSDFNVLQGVKSSSSCRALGDHQAVLTLSLFSRVPWGPSYVTRDSQHAILSSQTLQDLYDCVPCTSTTFPSETENQGFAICVGGLVYGNIDSVNGYSPQMFEHLKAITGEKIELSPSNAQGTQLSSLQLRLHEPYWMVHQGNCEHFLVIEQISDHDSHVTIWTSFPFLMSGPSQLVDALEQDDDILSWINNALSPDESDLSADLTGLDQHISQLIILLDLAAEDTSAQLERGIDDVVRGVPRLAYDLHFMKDGASSLQNALVSVLQRSKSAVPTETRDALDNLHALDTIKVRMEAARDVLREAESWSTLEQEVTSLIAEKSYARAAERLAEANKSVVVFQNTPEYDPRRTLMVNLQNQLEAALSTALVSAINAQDAKACKRHFSIFSVIQREAEFRNYYYASRRNTILSMWNNALIADCGSPTGGSDQSTVPLAEFLPKFYTHFLSVLNAERVPISSIFPDPLITLSQFIITTLSAFHPSLPQRLRSLASHHGDAALPHLIDALRATEEFAIGVEKILEKMKQLVDSHPPSQSSAATKPSHRRRSSRMSISWRTGPPRPSTNSDPPLKTLDTQDGMEWDQELFQPFLDFQLDYSSLERRYLDHTLRDAIGADEEPIQPSDRPRLLRERAVDLFGTAEESLARCKAFTHGYGSVGLLQALDDFLGSFFDSWKEDRGTNQKPAHLIRNNTSESDLSDLDYTAQDWSHIQLSLHLLASGRAISDRLASFENKLKTFVGQVASQFRLSLNDPRNFHTAATRGESQLLEQSTLNSADLHSLFLGVETDIIRDPPFSASLRHQPPPATSSPGIDFLSGAKKAVSNFALSCQLSMGNTILSPLRHHLNDYASSTLWKANDPNAASNTELRVPTFSLSPSEAIQKVADGLLNLPRLFEVYADDDALAFSIQTLPHVDATMLQGDHGSESTLQPGHRRRQSFAPSRVNSMDPEIVSSAWLISLGHIFTHFFVSDILPAIPTLSAAGATQLSSDLEYLSTTLRALNVEHATLEKWRMFVAMGQSDAVKALNSAGTAPLDPILEHVAKIRGWN